MLRQTKLLWCGFFCVFLLMIGTVAQATDRVSFYVVGTNSVRHTVQVGDVFTVEARSGEVDLRMSEPAMLDILTQRTEPYLGYSQWQVRALFPGQVNLRLLARHNGDNIGDPMIFFLTIRPRPLNAWFTQPDAADNARLVIGRTTPFYVEGGVRTVGAAGTTHYQVQLSSPQVRVTRHGYENQGMRGVFHVTPSTPGEFTLTVTDNERSIQKRMTVLDMVLRWNRNEVRMHEKALLTMENGTPPYRVNIVRHWPSIGQQPVQRPVTHQSVQDNVLEFKPLATGIVDLTITDANGVTKPTSLSIPLDRLAVQVSPSPAQITIGGKEVLLTVTGGVLTNSANYRVESSQPAVLAFKAIEKGKFSAITGNLNGQTRVTVYDDLGNHVETLIHVLLSNAQNKPGLK